MRSWIALVTTVVVSGAPASRGFAQQSAAHPPSAGVIAGSLTNSANGAAVRADVTIDRPRRGARSDSAGRFIFHDAQPGRVRVRAVSFGYEPVDSIVTVVAGDTVRLALRLRVLPQSLAPMRTVAKTPERARFEEQVTPSVVSISGAEVRRVPAIGETDVLRSVALLPGVVARNDFSAGFNVRGGEADQNLVLLDGIPIYNPFHLGGLFGTFIDKAVSGVDVLTGAFPTKYGGRLSSVLDVKSLEETRRGAHGAAEISLLSSSLFGGGALGGGKLSWNVAARRTYADKVVEWIRGNNDFPYHFQDAQLRSRLLLPNGGSVGLTVYAGKDLLYHRDESSPGAQLPNDPTNPFGSSNDDDETITFDWGNRVAGLTWDQPLGARTTMAQRLAFTRFATHFDLPSETVYLAQSVSEIQLGGSITHARVAHTLSAGYEAAAYRTSYREQLSLAGGGDSGDDVEFPDPLATDGDTTMRQRPAVAALYAEDLWKPNAKWFLRGGLRGEYVSGADWLGISPRLSLKYFASPTLAFTAAAGRYTQWMRAMRNEDLPLRVFDLWLGADETIPVSTSNHLVLGAEKWLSDTRFLRVEGYGKTYDKLSEPASTVDPRIRPSLLRYYDGRSYGLDVYLRQLERNGFSGWIAYSYGVTTRERNGRSYWPAHDRRHNANVVAGYAPAGSRWSLGSHLGLATGTPYTGWAGVMNRYRYDPIRNAWGGPRSDGEETVSGPRNAERFPFYWRLDVSAERRFDIGGATLRPYLNIVNVFNRKNVFLYTLDADQNPPLIKGASQFPFIPSVGLRMDW
ncbi:MAG TPA: carboxypeptidase regulatory-like domain-containing protein [Gemmatimonadaceae bacterium]|nr:carboxypeptidase regulatory-like domain-containing protein [Gemmatimonadaceae bacterium]